MSAPRNALADLAADWPTLGRLLDEVLSLPEPEREAWLKARRGDDAAQVPRLRQLLAGAAAAPSTLSASLSASAQSAAGVLAADGPQPGDRVGPWVLEHELGRGGMGTVWLAQRADGQLKRPVALKLPRLAWAPGLAARMARERDILATLEHPRIARLYDAGVDEHGRPWLALEVVQGEPIDRYCAAQALPLPQRLALVLQVCEAVGYAHSRLVIHRDLKPGNVLVTAEGEVRLLDFGIAKLLDPGQTDADGTEFGVRALTPDYASPEQLLGQPLGTTSDVYSLGVLAYEISTGRRPHGRSPGGDATDDEPPLASRQAPDTATARQLRGDLDAVLATALAREPARRYASVAALAADLQAALEGRPVTARAAPRRERLLRFVRRHRLPLAAAGVATLSLVAGAGLALWQAVQADAERAHAVEAAARAAAEARRADTLAQAEQQARRAADADRERAQQAERAAQQAAERAAALARAEARAAGTARREAERATAAHDFLVGLFQASSARSDDPQKAQQTTARQLLDLGADRLDTELGGSAAARLQLAGTLSTLYSELGLSERSLALARRAEADALRLHGPGHPQHLRAVAAVVQQLADGAGARAELPRWIERGETLLDARADPSREAARARSALARSLANGLQSTAPERAERLARRALQQAQASGEAREITASQGVLGMNLHRQGRAAEAEAALQASLAPVPGDAAAYDLTVRRATLAEVQASRLRFGPALDTLRTGLADSERRLGPEHLDTLQLRYRLGALLASSGRLLEAEPLLDEARRRWAAQGASRDLQRSLVLFDLGTLLRQAGRPEEARLQLDEGLALRARLRPRSLPAVQLRQELALVLQALGRADEARQRLREADAILQDIGAGPSVMNGQRLVSAELAMAAGQWVEADRLLQGLPSLDERQPPASRRAAQAWFNRVAVDLQIGRSADAQRRLQVLGIWLDAPALRDAVPALDIAWRVNCLQLLRHAQARPEAAAAHEDAARQQLLRHQGAGSLWGRELAGLAAQPEHPAQPEQGLASQTEATAGVTATSAMAACPVR